MIYHHGLREGVNKIVARSTLCPQSKILFFKRKKMQNVPKPKKLYFYENFGKIYSFAPVNVIKIYVN